MARRTTFDKRKLRGTLQRELSVEAARLMPELSRDIAQSILPLAATLTTEKAQELYTDASRASSIQQSARTLDTGSTQGPSIGGSVSIDADSKELRTLADALDNVGESFDAVVVKGGALDDMLKSTTAGISHFIGASDSDAAKKAFGALLKDLGTQAISGVQAMLLAAEAQSAVKGVLSFGTSLAVDAPLIAAAYVALEGAKAYINSLDTGGVVVGDQMIMAHDRETVIPYEKAPAFFAEAVNRGAGARDTFRSVYRPTEPTSTAASVRVSFGDMRGAIRQAEIRQARRSA